MIVADTGPLYAMIDASDRWHARVIEWWRGNVAPVVIPATVLPEVCYLLGTRIGPAAESAFVEAVVSGELTVEPLEREDYARAAALTRRYADLPIGFVDASVVAVAERLGARQVLTTDRRHFGAIQPSHARGFTLLP